MSSPLDAPQPPLPSQVEGAATTTDATSITPRGATDAGLIRSASDTVGELLDATTANRNALMVSWEQRELLAQQDAHEARRIHQQATALSDENRGRLFGAFARGALCGVGALAATWLCLQEPPRPNPHPRSLARRPRRRD